MSEALMALGKTLSTKQVLGAIDGYSGGRVKAADVVRFVMDSARRTPNLQRCTTDSILTAAYDAAKYGLLPDSVRGFAYLIPYGTECKLMIGWRGMVSMVVATGAVSRIEAHVVCEGDDYTYELGLDPVLKHTPRSAPENDASNVVAAYAIAKLPSGEQVFCWLWRNELDKIRSSAKSSDAWKNWPAAMFCKSAVRRLCSRVLCHIQAVHDVVAEVDSREGEFIDAVVTNAADAPARNADMAERVKASAARVKAAAEDDAPSMADFVAPPVGADPS